MNNDKQVDKNGFIYNRQERINETVESTHLSDGNIGLSYMETMRESPTEEFGVFDFLDELKVNASHVLDKQKAQSEIERHSTLLDRDKREA